MSSCDFNIELIEFSVGLIAGIILSTVVVAMVTGKLACVVASRYRILGVLTAGDVASDTDEHRDMLSSGVDDQPRSVDVGNDDTPAPLCGKRHGLCLTLLITRGRLPQILDLFQGLKIAVPSGCLWETSIFKIIMIDDVTLWSQLESTW